MSSIKISFENDVRRVKVDLTQSNAFDSIVEQLKVAFNLPTVAPVVLKYYDEENELITVTSSDELAEAARVSREAGKTVKLFASLAGSDIKSLSGDDSKIASPPPPSVVPTVDTSAAPVPSVDAPAAPVPLDSAQVNAAPVVAESVPAFAAPAVDAAPNLDGLDLNQVRALVFPFFMKPEVQSLLSTLAPQVLPLLQSAELPVSSAVELLLTGLEDVGLRQDPLIKLLEPHRAALVAIAETKLHLLRNLSTNGAGAQPNLLSPFALLSLLSGLQASPLQSAFAANPAVPPSCCASAPFASVSDAKAESKDSKPSHGTRCSGCSVFPVVGARFKCAVCPDCDLCASCEAKGLHPSEHPLYKINRPPAPAADSTARPVHHNVSCDGCNQRPLVGVRFKCSVCDNFDLCEDCERAGKHTAEHPLLKIREPRLEHRPSPQVDGRFNEIPIANFLSAFLNGSPGPTGRSCGPCGPRASPVAGPAVSPAVASPPPAPVAGIRCPDPRFQAQLDTMASMGFTDTERNIRALSATFGDVNAAIERLFA